MAEGAGRMDRGTGGQWPILVIGVLCCVAGIIVLAEPSISLGTLAVIVGIFLLVDGIIELVVVLTDSDRRGLDVVVGLGSVIVGVVLIRHPTSAVAVVALFLGLWLIISAVIRLLLLGAVREHRLWSFVVALIELVAGIVIVSSPDIGVKTLAILVGISFILRGLALCGVAWLMSRFAGEDAGTAAT